MQLSHIRPVVSASFDEPNLVSAAGLVPLMALAGRARLRDLADERLSVPTDKGAHAGLKVCSLVAGVGAGAGRTRDKGPPRPRGTGQGLHPPPPPPPLGAVLRSLLLRA